MHRKYFQQVLEKRKLDVGFAYLQSCKKAADPQAAAGHSQPSGGYKDQLALDWQVGLGYFASHIMCYKQETTVGWQSSCSTHVEGNGDG